MEIQKIIAFTILLGGIVYFVIFLVQIIKERKEKRLEVKRSLFFTEGLIYFLATLGISDFLMNTIAIKKLKIIEDDRIPHSLIATTIVPSSILSFLFLEKSGEIDLTMLIVYMVCLVIGAVIGSKISKDIKTAKLKSIMTALLKVSIVAIILKMLLPLKDANYVTKLMGWELVVLCLMALFMGIFNMFGIPMKPIAAALFLILGLSPIVALTMIQILGSINPLVGGIYVVKDKKYSK